VPLLTLPTSDVRLETPRTRVVRLGLAGRTFTFCAGQSVSVGLHGQRQRKPYSIASSPEDVARTGAVELLVQVGSDGSAGTHLGMPLPDVLVDVEGPTGSFCFPRSATEREFLFVAGGTGIAPVRAMLRHAIAAYPDCSAALFYSARAADEFAYGKEMRELAASGRLTLRETVTRDVAEGWTGERGRITRAHVAALATPATLCFVCGPAALVADVTGWLREIGISRNKVLSEGWS
jgi:NAD(P)H-flavin reductase